MEFDVRKTDPVVGVLVITYNHASLIRQCLDSLLIQETSFPYEICIGEDGSTDGTREICMEFAEKYPDRIRLILRSRDEPGREEYAAQGNYNYVETLKQCRGKYIADCDGDDTWLDPLKLQQQYDIMEKDPSLCLVHSDYAVLDNDSGEMLSEHEYRDKGIQHIVADDAKAFQFDVLTSNYKITTCTAFSRRSALMTVLEESGDLFKVYANGDTPMWCELAALGSFAYIDKPLAVYHILKESATHSENPETRLRFFNRNEDLKIHLSKKYDLPEKGLIQQKIRISNRLSMLSGDDSEIDELYRNQSNNFSLAEGLLYRFGKIKIIRSLLRRAYSRKYERKAKTEGHFESDSSTGRIVSNGFFTAARFVVYIISGILFIPYLLNKYGAGTYGLIALAGFLTQYVGLIQRCVGNAIARFLNIALNRRDWKQANEIFCTALAGNLAFIILQIPVLVLAIWKLDFIFDFPPDILMDFRVLVICNSFVFMISMLSGVLSTPIQAANRLDITTTIDSLQMVVRIILLVVLIEFVGAKLWIIGIVDVLLALSNGGFITVMCRRLAPELKFHWHYVTKTWIRPIMKMAGWSIVTALGGYLFVKTDVWMINRFVNNEMAGIYAALLVWPNFLRQVSKQLASILAPVYMIDYARGDIKRVARLSFSSAKLLGCFVGLAVGVLCVIAEPLLEIWLGSSGSAQYTGLFRVMIIYLTFTIGEAVLWQIYITLNKVQYTGIVSIVAGVVNIVVSLSLIKAGFGAMGVAVGTALAQMLSSTLAIPLGVCREFKIPSRMVLWNYFCAALMLALAWGSSAVAWNLLEKSMVLSIVSFTLLFGIGLVILSRFILSKDEAILLMELIEKIKLKLAR